MTDDDIFNKKQQIRMTAAGKNANIATTFFGMAVMLSNTAGACRNADAGKGINADTGGRIGPVTGAALGGVVAAGNIALAAAGQKRLRKLAEELDEMELEQEPKTLKFP